MEKSEQNLDIREALTYRGEALRAVALPLGGIGTGSVALAGDGGLRQWQITNTVNHDAHVSDSFFAIWTGEEGAVPAAVVLQSAELYDDEDFIPAPSVSDHLIPAGSRQLLAEAPGVESVELTALYPIVEVAYQSDAIPVEAQLEAFSPFIPLNSKDSGLPVVIFNFTVYNPDDQAAPISLLAAQQNMVGWDGKSEIDGIYNPGYGGNVNHLSDEGGFTVLEMKNTYLDAKHPTNGSLALAVFGQPDDKISAMPQWQSLSELWHDFEHTGQLSQQNGSGASAIGKTWNGALAIHFDLAAGESRTATFMLAWHFPNRYVTWDQRHMGVHDGKSQFWLGNMYNNWFDGALDVVEYVQGEYDRLVTQTRLYRDRYFDSTLPWQLVESVAGPVSTIRSPTCLWNEDGRFYGFEGCHGASTSHGNMEGCCPMNCTHVWNYEMALSRLYPDLEQSMRHTDLVDQISPQGAIPHRTPLPLYLARPWDEFIGGPRNPAMDGELGTVLKTYREVRQDANATWFEKMWPHVKALMHHIMTDYDTEGDGVIRCEQPNTYDISIYGPNTFIGSLYLAALRAAEEMAKLQGEDDLANHYRVRFELGSQNYDRLCWNGEYYIQIVDLAEHKEQQYGSGCHIDQLLGQWWAHILGLGYVLPEQHVKTAALNIYKHNRRQGFKLAAQKPRIYMDERDSGLYICTWPHGGKPDVPTQYSDEVWSGLEYPLASLLLFEGFIEQALTILVDIRERHNGTRRSPWNEVECGDHYVRPMASWSLLEAATGFRFDAVARSLTYAPCIDADEDHHSFYVAGNAWGGISRGESGVRLSVDYGQLSLNTLGLKTGFTNAVVHLDEQLVVIDIERSGAVMHLRFVEPVVIAAGDSLMVTLY